MKNHKTTNKTGDATYCASCGRRPKPGQRRMSKRIKSRDSGRALMVCSFCAKKEMV